MSLPAFRSPYHVADVRGPHLELESGRHAVTCLKRVRLWSLAVRMKIDEAGRNDEPCRVDGRAPCQAVAGNRGDLPAADSDVTDAIQARLGIEHAAVRDDQIKVLRREQRRARTVAKSEQHGTAHIRLRIVYVCLSQPGRDEGCSPRNGSSVSSAASGLSKLPAEVTQRHALWREVDDRESVFFERRQPFINVEARRRQRRRPRTSDGHPGRPVPTGPGSTLMTGFAADRCQTF